MLGDVADFVRRMLAVLPARWFADTAPILSGLLAGFGAAWSSVYNLIATVRLLARIATATGPFLDMISADFFGAGLPRRSNETDAAFLTRIRQELFRQRGTRQALVTALTQLTGQIPSVFEPARPADTGGYTLGGVGYSAGGGWGNLSLQHQSFVIAFRPRGAGIAELAGYGTGGYLAYGNLAQVASPVSDADIYAEAAAVLPAGYIAWMRLTD